MSVLDCFFNDRAERKIPTKQDFLIVEEYLSQMERDFHIFLLQERWKRVFQTDYVADLIHFYLNRSFNFRQMLRSYARKDYKIDYPIQRNLYESKDDNFIAINFIICEEPHLKLAKREDRVFIDLLASYTRNLLEFFLILYKLYEYRGVHSIEFLAQWTVPERKFE